LCVLCYCLLFKSFNVLSFLPIIFPLLFTNIRGFFYAKIPYRLPRTLKQIPTRIKDRSCSSYSISRCGSLTVNCLVRRSHNYTVRLPSHHPPRNLRDYVRTICTRISDFLDLSVTTLNSLCLNLQGKTSSFPSRNICPSPSPISG
jgi:hypothetical protein